MAEKKQKYAAPAISKMFDIVELMARENRAFGINELSRALEMPVNTVYRIVMEMEHRGYAEKSGTGYALGAKFFVLGQIAGSRIDMRTKALPVMKELSEQTGETVHLAILQGDRMVLLDQIETTNPLRIHADTGSILYPHASAFGKCMLAFADEKFMNEYIRKGLASLTERTITDGGKLRSELSGIRTNGFAFDYEEYLNGVRCIGAPVHGTDTMGIASIGIVAPAYRLSEERMKGIASVVIEASNRISETMGRTGRQFAGVQHV
ncbi:MAG: IclR family transcriptional regulator [Spirochaetota bacterium]